MTPSGRHARRWRPALAFACLALWVTWAAGADPPKKTFHLPEGDAAVSLREFSRQAGEQIVYPIDFVRGVRTNTVRGDYTPPIALGHMVAGTVLFVFQDEKTGALTVGRRSPPQRPPDAPSKGPPTSQLEPSSAVKTQKFTVVRRSWLMSIASLMSAAVGFAQNPAQSALPSATHGSSTAGAHGRISGRVKNVATGQYLNNARVTVKGTSLVAFTDQTGTYRLVNVPTGPVVLQTFYTDLDLLEIPLEISAGGAVEQDIALTSAVRYGSNAAVMKLDPFLVSTNRETDAQALASNEQRFAPNIKNVLSSDSIGDVMGSSVGDFLKFVPGLTGEFAAGEIVGISIRGIGGGMTSFSANGGVPKVSPFFAGGRDYHMINLSLNDISRIDITKVPTPSTAADSLAGSVDLISKSAFERSTAELRYSVNLAANSNALTAKKQPFIRGEERHYQIHPVVDFDYTLPVGKNFGLVVTGMLNERFYPTSFVATTYNSAGTSTGASFTSPYLQTVQLGDTQRVQVRNTLSFKADWRVTPHGVLSFTNQYNYYDNISGGVNMTFNAGTVGTPTIAGGVPLSFGSTSTMGATGRGAVTMSASESTWEGFGNTTDLGYRFDDGRWRITSTLSYSISTVEFLPIYSGHFNGLSAVLVPPVQIKFNAFEADGPKSIDVNDNAASAVNLYNIANYRISAASLTRSKNAAGVKAGTLNVGRTLDLFRFPLALQAGGSRRVQTRDIERQSSGWTHNGPDGVAATFESPAPYMAEVYNEGSATFASLGNQRLPWISTTRAYRAWKDNPTLFSQTLAQKVAEESYRRRESEYVEESVDALYLQADARFFQSRLRVLTGVRYERTHAEGQGSLSDPDGVFVRQSNGAFARDPQGAKIRKPGSGIAGSLEELDFILRERATTNSRVYDGFYPSLHFTLNLREDLLLRAAYAKTYGRPNFNDIVPRTVISRINVGDIDEDDPANFKGDLIVRNPTLDPWTADNYDLSLEYYTRQGGQFSAGVFVKELRGFYGDSVKVATVEDLADLGFDERYVGWNLRSKFNSGSARISGVELSARHSLRAVGDWGRYFSVFANATKLRLEGNPGASFTSFIPKSANWGISFNRSRLTLSAKWNYRGLDKRVARPAFGPDGFQYIESRYSLDADVTYQLTKKIALAASVNNALNAPLTLLDYGSSTPGYARLSRTTDSGAFIAVGLKGKF